MKKNLKPKLRDVRTKRERLLERYGLDPAEYPRWRQKWNNLHTGCTKLGDRECALTFGQYVKLARNAGLTSADQIGRSRGQYQLARHGDRGDYVIGNCRFITMEQNQRERLYNGGTAVAVEKAARIRRGQTKTNNASIASMSKKLAGRTSDTHDYLRVAGLKRGKPFVLKSPDGKVYTGMSLNAFCKEHGLAQCSMQAVVSGRWAQCRGWTGHYIT